MPIYEYFCPSCRTKFELLRPMARADEAASCPDCRSNAQRLLSAFACFSKSSDGTSTPVAGGSACSACSSRSCSTCG